MRESLSQAGLRSIDISSSTPKPSASPRKPIRVPTGIQITAVSFPDPTSATVNGLVWQRYPAILPADSARGFWLPQLNSDQFFLQEVQRATQGQEETVVWSFGAVLKQNFDPAWFPFDGRRISIRIMPAELNRNVVLVPDLHSYKLLNPLSLPGVSKDVRISNWTLRSSYFSYQTTPLDATLGLPSLAERTNTPILSFNVETQRVFIGPFVAYLLPGIVGAAITFAFLMSDREVGDSQDLVAALSYAAALFFVIVLGVIVLGHTALRESIAAVRITYLEYLYVLLYALLLLVVVDAFLVVRRPGAVLIQYRNNLIPKVLYWPAAAVVLLLATLGTFVYGPAP
jgi:hypothetical protein